MPTQNLQMLTHKYFSLSLNIKVQVPIFGSWEIVLWDRIVDGGAASGVPPVQGSVLS